MNARELMNVTITEAVNDYMDEINTIHAKEWMEYKPEIIALRALKGHKKISKTDSLVDRLNELATLYEKIEKLEKSNAILVKECDYLRWELRDNDKDFWDANPELLKENRED